MKDLTCDVALVGAGVMSATLATLLSSLDPSLKLVIIERQPEPAQESSNAWNNAGTGHAGMCELNYSVEQPDGSVDVSKAVRINEQFQVSRQLWASLVTAGVIADPSSFINPTAHMSFITGAPGVRYMRTRYETMIANPLYSTMKFSDDLGQIEQWAPLLARGRTPSQPIACTWDPEGTDVNFGSLTTQLLAWLQSRGAVLECDHEVTGLQRQADGTWVLQAKGRTGADGLVVRASRLFVGAGGYALSLLQKAHLPEVRGIGLFPISGKFLVTNAPDVVAQHGAKVYGQAEVGAPPMSVPHLDARVIDGEKWVLFGPFAGQSITFLKHGSIWDAPRMVRPHNLIPMLQVAIDNFGLLNYLGQQILASKTKQYNQLRAFYPQADPSQWHMTVAGQRAQVIKVGPNGRGSLEFGTETIFAANDTVAAVLGASPGASTAVPIMLAVLKRVFADRMDGWEPKLRELIPTWGTPLSDDADLAQRTRERTADILKITRPTA
ncbi:MAG: malate dehydrogenase (quinone) [Propionibacteriaceae bacterium]|nr:malate dehydrogenase (quinone) [Propionibacteriaceae bacterium]